MRCYSPVPRSRPLDESDTNEACFARMLELGNDLEECMEFVKDLCYHVKESEDLKAMDGMQKITEKAIDEHLAVMDEGGKQLFKINYELDEAIRDMVEFQQSMGIECDAH